MARNYERDELVGLPTTVVDTLKNIVDAYDKEDKQERDSRKPLWTRLENYFNGMQRLFWNESVRDWRVVDADKDASLRHYDKIINIYRPHGEAIIAALSVKTPSTIFYPEDAEVEEDIVTAKVCQKIKQQIERHNKAQLLIIRSLMILFNQGVVAAYVYNKKHSSYGTYSVPTFGNPEKRTTVLLNCPECGSNIREVIFAEAEKVKVDETQEVCPVCDYNGIPQQETYDEEVPKIVGSELFAKGRTTIEVYSPLYVYLPFYARSQEHLPYIRLKFEQHLSSLRELYPKLCKKGIDSSIDTDSAEDRRIYINVNSNNLCTVDCWWIRPWGFHVITNKENEIKKLKDKYPDGCYAVYIDDQLVEIVNESLDEHWRISNNPLSQYVHAEPLGKPLAPIQDLKNEVTDLQIETFEHSIPETFVDGSVLNFNKYKNSKAQPGMVFPVTSPADGQSVGSKFHTIKTATLSEEYDAFSRRIDGEAQFSVGSYPSIYGGPNTGGSKTAREYTESRAMAMQRLGITFNILKYFWSDVMAIAVPLYIHLLKQTGEDDKMVEKQKGGFVNTWIRQSDIQGNIGNIEADPDEDLPQSRAQLKDVVMSLMALKDENIQHAIFHPENTPLLTNILGAPDFYIPDSDDRDKQYSEFTDLLKGIPVQVKPWEKHDIEAEICRTFLVSPTGRMLEKSNSEGYAAIEQHMDEHKAAMQTPMANLPPMMEGEGGDKLPVKQPNIHNQPAPGAVNPAMGMRQGV